MLRFRFLRWIPSETVPFTPDSAILLREVSQAFKGLNRPFTGYQAGVGWRWPPFSKGSRGSRPGLYDVAAPRLSKFRRNRSGTDSAQDNMRFVVTGPKGRRTCNAGGANPSSVLGVGCSLYRRRMSLRREWICPGCPLARFALHVLRSQRPAALANTRVRRDSDSSLTAPRP